MSPLGHHVLHLTVFCGSLFLIGLVAALRERRQKLARRVERPSGR